MVHLRSRRCSGEKYASEQYRAEGFGFELWGVPTITGRFGGPCHEDSGVAGSLSGSPSYANYHFEHSFYDPGLALALEGCLNTLGHMFRGAGMGQAKLEGLCVEGIMLVGELRSLSLNSC